MSRMVLVGHPLSGAGSPVLQDEVLRVLLTLAAAEPALGGRPGQPVLPVQVDLDPLSDPGFDHLLGAPGTTVDVFAQPLKKF